MTRILLLAVALSAVASSPGLGVRPTNDEIARAREWFSARFGEAEQRAGLETAEKGLQVTLTSRPGAALFVLSESTVVLEPTVPAWLRSPGDSH